MSISIYKTLHQITRSAVINSQPHYHYFSGIRPFSSSLASIDQTPNQQHSFAVNYLMNSYGFTLEKAITASKRMNFETPEKPDSVIAFFCNHGFTKTQASNLILKCPKFLSSKPDKTLLPKLEFLKSIGISSTDVVKILSRTPTLLERSLENQIIPSFEFVKNLIGSEERTLSGIKKNAGLLLVDFESRMAPNVDILREFGGVPDARIAFLLTYQPRVFMMSPEKFRQIVKEVKGMGLNPLRVSFISAVNMFCSMSKLTWERKIEVFKKWGLSADDILVAFGKHPRFMAASEDKIMGVMDFLVNKMGFESSLVSKNPQLFTLSLKKRIEPRGLVCQSLQAKGLIKKPYVSFKMLMHAEMWFIQKVVDLAKEEAPELLKLYKEKLALAR